MKLQHMLRNIHKTHIKNSHTVKSVKLCVVVVVIHNNKKVKEKKKSSLLHHTDGITHTRSGSEKKKNDWLMIKPANFFFSDDLTRDYCHQKYTATNC